MSFFGRIKSAVRGNPVLREYELNKHVGSAGPGLMWKIFSAVKKSTRQPASVFMFNKQTPEFEKLPKKSREAILEMLKKGPAQLIKLRHPRLLTIDHPIEESGDCLAFATEPLFASLANILGHYDNLPTPLPLVIKEHDLHPIEIQYGLLQLAEALDFLHRDVKMMHGNLTPESVVINQQGLWKLMGFNFCCFSHYQSEAQITFQFREWDSRRPLHTNPALDYLAPEYILSKSCSERSDVYSFCMLTFAAYNQGKPLYESNNNMLSYKQNVEQVSRVTEAVLGQVPAEFKSVVREGLAMEPSVRPDALQITKNAFFEEVGVNSLKYLDMLYQRGDMEKSQFFKKNLARVITKLPKRVVHQRVLPALGAEFRNPRMIPFILPLVLLIAEDCSMQEYVTLVMPILIPALQIQEPIQVPLIFLQKMDLLLKKTTPDEVKRYILPMIIRSMESHSQLQELCVSVIPSFANMVDYSSMKHSLVPRITSLCMSTKSLPLRIKCLVSLGQMLDILDKHIVLDHIVPILEQIPSREPGVLMAILGIYHQTLVNKKLGLDKLMLANRVLPYLIPLSVEPTLNVQQFHQFMLVIREMLKKVEADQQTHLEQLSEMEEQTKSTVDFAREVSETKAMDDALNKLEGMFGSSGSHDLFAPPRRGAALPNTQAAATSGAVTTGSSDTSEVPDLFAGLMLDDPVQPSTSTTAPTLQPTPNATKVAIPSITATGTKSSPQLNRPSSEPLKAIVIPAQNSTPTLTGQASQLPMSNPLSTTSSLTTSYTPPPLRPQKTATSGSGLGDLDLLSSQPSSNLGNMQPQSSTGASWSSNIMAPTSSTGPMGLSGFGNSSSSQMASGSGSLFSGMQVNPVPGPSQLNPIPMQPSSGSLPMQQQMSGGNFMTPTPPQGHMTPTPPQGHMTTATNQNAYGSMGMAQTLIPTPAQHGSGGSLGNAGSGWSSNIRTQSPQSGLNTQPQAAHMHSQNPTDWSSGMAANSLGSQLSGSNIGAGWSSNIPGQGTQGGVGMRQMQNPSTNWSSGIQTGQGVNNQQHGSFNAAAQGMAPQQQSGPSAGGGMGGWSDNIQGGGSYSGGLQATNPPMAANLMMGGGQQTGMVPQNTSMLQPQQASVQFPGSKPAPGANPFANLSFLS